MPFVPLPLVAAGLGQFPVPSALGASSDSPLREGVLCYIQDCQVSPSDFLPSPDPAAPCPACLRVSPCPGGAAHGPAQRPGCEGNPLGQQHKGFQALAKQTGLWWWSLACTRRFQAVAMWLPWDVELQGWEEAGWCPSVPPCFWGTRLCTAAWGD